MKVPITVIFCCLFTASFNLVEVAILMPTAQISTNQQYIRESPPFQK